VLLDLLDEVDTEVDRVDVHEHLSGVGEPVVEPAGEVGVALPAVAEEDAGGRPRLRRPERVAEPPFEQGFAGRLGRLRRVSR
jgi:hypothetical protein